MAALGRWLGLLTYTQHERCRPRACDCVLSCLAVRAVLLRVAALMEASRQQAQALTAKRYAEKLQR
jgi:hypothetical protein